LAHIHVLKASSFGRFLISAYDLAQETDEERSAAHELIFECQSLGFEVMLDSGGYEAHWREDTSWSEPYYEETARRLRDTVSLGFDYPQPTDRDDEAAVRHAAHGSEIAARQGVASDVVPIIHSAENLEAVAVEVGRVTGSEWIAVPEKELGAGILERSARLASLRAVLDEKAPQSMRIHVLGAGSPLDVAVYSVSGADSFDGLEWSRCFIDPSTLRCHNAAYWELIDPGGWREGTDLGWFAGLALNNLIALREWMDSLESAFEEGRLVDLVTDQFPELRGR